MTHREKKQAVAPSRKMNQWLALALSVGLTLAAGIMYGGYSQRWGPAADLQAAADHLESMPTEFGSWQLAEDLILEESVVKMLDCTGYVNRRYVNQKTGQIVTLAIIVGPPGPTAVHTPEICYSSRAYKRKNHREEVSIGDLPMAKNTFWGVSFEANSALADNLQVYYAWSAGKYWEASESPRYEFAALPMLFKIQLAGTVTPGFDQNSQNSCREFLEALLQTDWELTTS